MRTLISTTLIVLLTALSFASVPQINSSNNLTVDRKQVYRNSMNFSISIESPQWTTDTSNPDYSSAEYTGESSQIVNNMDIPSISRLFRMPPSGNAEIIIVDSSYEIISDVEYARDFNLDNSFEYVDRWYPENIISLSSPAIFNDFRVASLTTFPVQVNPYRNEVRVYNNVEFEIRYDNSTGENSILSYPAAISESFIPFYRDFLDWDETELDNFRIYRGNVQVIVQNSAQTLNILQPWIEWKKQKGWNIELLTDDDVAWNQNAIKNELINRFTSTPEHFDHIVIIGDANGMIWVPPGTGSGYGAGDQGYTTLVGDDNLFDVALGRISVSSNNDLVTYVNKVLSYEQHPYMQSTDWYKRALVSAGSSNSGISTVYVCEYARQELYQAGYDTVLTVYYNDNGGDINSRIIGGLNSGTSFHVYRGFGGTGISNGNIAALNNVNKIPVVVDITCNRGNWADGTGVNESYIRAGSTTTPRGAISAISTATGNTHTRFNNSLTGGAVEAVLAKKMPTVGDMMNGAKYNLWKNLNTFEYQNVNNFSRWTNLMGDPTVWIWTDIPRPLTVTAENVLELGESTYYVTVEDENGPLPNAWVTLYKSDENEEIIAHSITDETGNVILETPFRYEGEAVLTVTAQNAQPFILDVEVSNASQRIAIIECNVVDPDNGSTSGNNNGIPEYNETIGLGLTLYNYSSNSQSNIDVSIGSSDPYVLSTSGNAELTNLNAGSETALSDNLIVEISQETPNGWLQEIEVTINSDQGSYSDVIVLEINAPSLFDAPGLPDEELIPGSSANIHFNIFNNGPSPASGGTINLISDDDWLTVINSTGTIGEIDTGTFNTSTEFQVEASTESYRGYQADGHLEISFENGRHENIPVKIAYGVAESNDPTGPDSYGYTAYDSSDEDYILTPDYNWIEINSEAPVYTFPGIDLGLRDLGENQDASVTVDLPFTIEYYGESYDQMTVCSNGWVAMGDQDRMALHRNWTIPSPLGPSAMIAPYWDNRIMETGGIYYYADESLDMVIVQWENSLDYLLGSPCTFQVVIFKQPDINPSSTGDCDILFQYKEANHSAGESHDVAFWTTGIENQNQDDGLLYAFHNNYETGSAHIEDESSILFTTRRGLQTGILSGNIQDSDDNEIIEGATVSIVFPGRSCDSDDEGDFEIEAPAGNFQVIVSHPDYYTEILDNVEILPGEQNNIQIQLTSNTFIIDPTYLNINVEENTLQTFDISLSNTGADTIFFSSGVCPYDPTTGPQNIGELYAQVPLSDSYVNGTVRDILFDGSYYWILNTNGGTSSTLNRVSALGILHGTYTLNQFYSELERDGDEIRMIGFREMSNFYFDGTSLTETSSQDLLISFNGAAYDESDDLLYLANNTGLRSFDMNGNLQSTLYTGNRVSDVCLMPDDPDGKIIHFLAYIDSSNRYIPRLYRMNPDDSSIERTLDLDRSYYQINSSIDIFNTTHSNSLIAVYENNWTDMVVDVYEYFPTKTIATVEPVSGTLPPGATTTALINVLVDVFPVETIENWVVFEHNGFFRREKVHLIVNSPESEITSKSSVPENWEISNISPNPFNSSAKISFSIPEISDVKIDLYNILGQKVQTVLNSKLEAGYHSISVDGSKLASGMYFVEFKSGPLDVNRKIVLLK